MRAVSLVAGVALLGGCVLVFEQSPTSSDAAPKDAAPTDAALVDGGDGAPRDLGLRDSPRDRGTADRSRDAKGERPLDAPTGPEGPPPKKVTLDKASTGITTSGSTVLTWLHQVGSVLSCSNPSVLVVAVGLAGSAKVASVKAGSTTLSVAGSSCAGAFTGLYVLKSPAAGSTVITVTLDSMGAGMAGSSTWCNVDTQLALPQGLCVLTPAPQVSVAPSASVGGAVVDVVVAVGALSVTATPVVAARHELWSGTLGTGGAAASGWLEVSAPGYVGWKVPATATWNWTHLDLEPM